MKRCDCCWQEIKELSGELELTEEWEKILTSHLKKAKT